MFRVVAMLLLLSLSLRGDDNWPQFRGGSKGGVAEAKTLPDTWDTRKNVVWKADVPGRGWSSPIVWGDRVYLTTVVSDKEPQNPKKGLYIEDLQGKVPPGEHRWLVLCLDFKTGKTLWQREVNKGKPTKPVHVKNTYASSTPVTDGERVYVYFGNVGVFCFDREGKPLWSKPLDPKATQLNWGPAASLTLHGDRLFLINDNDEESFLTALDTRTGKEVWKVSRDEKSNWATPFIWNSGKRVEVVTVGKGKVRSYDLEGKQLWELAGTSSIAIPTPVAGDGLLYVTAGYVLDPRRPLYAIRPGASGDISLKGAETNNKFIAWTQKQAGPYHPSPVLYGEYVYILLDRGMLSCYEAKTGKVMYDRQRLPGATAFTASPWAYNGKLFCLSEDGETYVIRAGPEFEVLGRNQLEEMTLATPALAQGSLLLRTAHKLYQIRKVD